MFKTKLSPFLAAVPLSLAMLSPAQAAIIIDDFSKPNPGQVFCDNTGAGFTQNTANPSAAASLRSTTHTLLTAGAVGSNAGCNLSSAGTGASPNFQVGWLNMNNGTDVDSSVLAVWTLNALAGFSGLTPVTFDVTSNNLGAGGASPNTVEARFNGTSLGTQNMSVGTMTFLLSGAQVALLGTPGNTVSLFFNGVTEWDAAIDNLRIPEPGSLALLGLGLVGLAFARRRLG